MITLRTRLLPQEVDYFNHVCWISHHKKILNIQNIFVSYLQYFFSDWTYGIFCAWSRVVWRTESDKHTMPIHIRSHRYSNNLNDYIKPHDLISAKMEYDIEQSVFSLCAKVRVCPLCDSSTICQPLFRGWGPSLRGGIVIWLARALWALEARQHFIGLTLTLSLGIRFPWLTSWASTPRCPK